MTPVADIGSWVSGAQWAMPFFFDAAMVVLGAASIIALRILLRMNHSMKRSETPDAIVPVQAMQEKASQDIDADPDPPAIAPNVSISLALGNLTRMVMNETGLDQRTSVEFISYMANKMTDPQKRIKENTSSAPISALSEEPVRLGVKQESKPANRPDSEIVRRLDGRPVKRLEGKASPQGLDSKPASRQPDVEIVKRLDGKVASPQEPDNKLASLQASKKVNNRDLDGEILRRLGGKPVGNLHGKQASQQKPDSEPGNRQDGKQASPQGPGTEIARRLDGRPVSRLDGNPASRQTSKSVNRPEPVSEVVSYLDRKQVKRIDGEANRQVLDSKVANSQASRPVNHAASDSQTVRGARQREEVLSGDFNTSKAVASQSGRRSYEQSPSSQVKGGLSGGPRMKRMKEPDSEEET